MEKLSIRTGKQSSQNENNRSKTSNAPVDVFERGDENISDDSNDFYQNNTSYRRRDQIDSKFDRFNHLYDKAKYLR